MFRVKLAVEDKPDAKDMRWRTGDLALWVDESGNKILLFLMPNKTYSVPMVVEQKAADGKWCPFDATAFVADRRLSAGVYKIKTEV